MNKYEIRTQKKKNAIIQASLALFRTKGYTGTSVNEIAAEANVSAVSIYNYFQSKENLVKECASALLGETNGMVNELLQGEMSFKDKLLQAVALCSKKPHELLAEYFSVEALEDKTFVELFNKEVNEVRMDVFSTFIESGKADGSVDSSVATEMVIQFLRAALEVQSSWSTQEEYKEKAGELYHLVLYGIIGK